jgi:hypothetical protein
VQHLGVVPAHQQRGDERAEELGQAVRGHLAPREALEHRERDGDRRIQVRAADPAGDVDAEHDAQAPGPRDAVVVADLAARHLRDDAHAEQDEDHGPGELGGEFAHQSRDLQSCCHAPSRVRCGPR